VIQQGLEEGHRVLSWLCVCCFCFAQQNLITSQVLAMLLALLPQLLGISVCFT
jgi:hypothetical protein